MTENEQSNNSGEQTTRQAIPVRWNSGLDLPTIYVNQLYITHGGKEFYLVFGETAIPVLLGVPGEALPDRLEIKPLVKIAVAHEAMIEFANIISQNVSKFISRMSEDEVEGEESLDE